MGKALSRPDDADRTFDDDYTIGAKIGSGAFAEVFACAPRAQPEARRAVKVVRQANLHASMRRQIKEETEILAMLEHKYIVKLYDVYRTEAEVRIVQESCEGGTLLDRVKQKGRYAEAEARDVVKHLLSAVAYAHSNGVVHRDLKPENVLLTRRNSDRDIRLADWGVSRRFEGCMQTIVGTPPYMAPEVLEKALDKGATRHTGYDERMDVWSVGVITFILLSGKHPFDDPIVPILVQNVLKAPVHFEDPAFDQVSEAAKDFLLSLLERDVGQRPTAAACLDHPWIRMPLGEAEGDDAWEALRPDVAVEPAAPPTPTPSRSSSKRFSPPKARLGAGAGLLNPLMTHGTPLPTTPTPPVDVPRPRLGSGLLNALATHGTVFPAYAHTSSSSTSTTTTTSNYERRKDVNSSSAGRDRAVGGKYERRKAVLIGAEEFPEAAGVFSEATSSSTSSSASSLADIERPE